MFNYVNDINTTFVDGSITSFGTFFAVVINALMGGLFSIGFIAVAVGLVSFVSSKGEPKATEKAGKTLTWGIIGVLVAFFVFVIKGIVINMLGIQGDIQQNVPTSI